MEKDIKQEISKQLDKGIREHERSRQSKEQWRKKFEAVGKGAMALYEEEVKRALPLAEEKMESVILPWWKEFNETGLYDKAIKYIPRSSNYDLRISDSILYYWPDDALREMRRQKPFEFNAEFIMEETKKKREDEFVQTKYRYQDEFWWAYFDIENWHGFKGINIGRWPLFGGGYGFALSRRQNLEIKTQSIDESLLRRIHPAVFLGFADQIQDGTVWKVINSSLKLKSNDFSELVTDSERHQEHLSDIDAANEFIRKRKEGTLWLSR